MLPDEPEILQRSPSQRQADPLTHTLRRPPDPSWTATLRNSVELSTSLLASFCSHSSLSLECPRLAVTYSLLLSQDPVQGGPELLARMNARNIQTLGQPQSQAGKPPVLSKARCLNLPAYQLERERSPLPRLPLRTSSPKSCPKDLQGLQSQGETGK